MQPEVIGPVDPNEHVEVSVVLKPRHALPDLENLRTPMSREEFAENYGANPADIATLEAFAHQHALRVIEVSQPRRTVHLGGRAGHVEKAFGVSLVRRREPDGTEHRAVTKDVQLSGDLKEMVQAVFGLDTRPIAQPRST